MDHVKEELEKEKVTTSCSSLKVQRDALLEAKDRRREAKELTRELLTIKTRGAGAGRAQEVCVEFDKRQLELLTLITGLEDSLAPQQGVGGAAQPGAGHLMFEKLKLPEFDDVRRNYLTFKLEWGDTAGYSGYSLEIEVRELRKKLPKEVQADVKVMRTTA